MLSLLIYGLSDDQSSQSTCRPKSKRSENKTEKFYATANLLEIYLLSAMFISPIAFSYKFTILKSQSLQTENRWLHVLTILGLLSNISHMISALYEYSLFKKIHNNKSLKNVLYKSPKFDAKLNWFHLFIGIPKDIISFCLDKISDILAILVYLQVLNNGGWNLATSENGGDLIVLVWAILATFIFLAPDIYIANEATQRISALIEADQSQQNQNKSKLFLTSKWSRILRQLGFGPIIMSLDMYFTKPFRGLITYKKALSSQLKVLSTYLEGCPAMFLSFFIYAYLDGLQDSGKYPEISEKFNKTFIKNPINGKEIISGKLMILLSSAVGMISNTYRVVLD